MARALATKTFVVTVEHCVRTWGTLEVKAENLGEAKVIAAHQAHKRKIFDKIKPKADKTWAVFARQK
jgi:hypothetical protein